MNGSKIYKLSTGSPIANIVMFFTERILDKRYLVKVGDCITSIQTGKTPPMNVSKYYSSNDIGWVKPSDIGKGKYLMDIPDKLSQIAIDENKVTIYQPGTLLIICIGAGVGRVALTNIVLSSNQQITGILFNSKVIPEYAYYYFFCREAIFKQNTSQTTLPIINQKGLKELEFKCPLKDIQQAFLNYLHYCEECLIKEEVPTERSFDLPELLFDKTKQFFITYYAQSNILKELIQQQSHLHLLRQTILQEAVQGKLTQQNPADEPASELLKRIKAEKQKLTKEGKLKKEKELPPITDDEIPFALPEGWVWCRLGDVALVSEAGKSFQCSERQIINDEWGIIKMSAISSGTFKESENKFFKSTFAEEQTHKIKSGDLLFARASGSKDLTGVSTVVKAINKNLLLNDKTIRFQFPAYLNVELLNVWNNSSFGRHYYQKIMGSKTTTMNNITRDQFNCLPLPLPPLSEQHRVVSKVEQFQFHITQLEQQVTTSQTQARQLLQAVLAEAFEAKEKVYEVNEELTLAAEG